VLIGLVTLERAETLEQARERADALRGIVSRTLHDIGRLARGLHPSVLDDLGLEEAVRLYVEEYSRTCGVAIEIRSQGLEVGRLSAPLETTLYRILQEALTNCVKHSGARQVEITLARRNGVVELVVRDDGTGFEHGAHSDAAPALHLGLYGMRERAEILGGTVAIESGPGRGTTIHARVPFGEPGPGDARDREALLGVQQ
jgi:signal transduction histidine kinase